MHPDWGIHFQLGSPCWRGEPWRRGLKQAVPAHPIPKLKCGWFMDSCCDLPWTFFRCICLPLFLPAIIGFTITPKSVTGNRLKAWAERKLSILNHVRYFHQQWENGNTKVLSKLEKKMTIWLVQLYPKWEFNGKLDIVKELKENDELLLIFKEGNYSF